MRRLLRVCVVATLAVPVLAMAAPAQASCAEDSGPAGSPVVFVGTAEESRRGYTKLAVDEVWHGPDLAPQVWVLAGQKQLPFPLGLVEGVGSSIDADLVEGHRYVIGAGRTFTTSVCSIREVTGPTARTSGRPAHPRAPDAEGLDGADPPAGPWTIGLGAAAVLLAGAGLVSWVRRRVRASGTSTAT